MASKNDFLEKENKPIRVLLTIYKWESRGQLMTSNSDIISYIRMKNNKELYDILKYLLDCGWIKEISPLTGLLIKKQGYYAAVALTKTGLIYVKNVKKKIKEVDESILRDIFDYPYVE
ncbi:hypothetical protein [Microcoleus sp. D3_18_C4]|uniref:hypothetical protein n=1 Tax=Microcoleus sp. D3_18_C4 TaxID=3055335 RepID=UPI002FD3F2AB